MKIADYSLLTLGTEVLIHTATKRIQLVVAGDLTADGVTLKALYQFLKVQWKDNPLFPMYDFPIKTFGEQYELVEGWDFHDQATKNLIRDNGWALKDTSNNSLEEYMNITTLGNTEDPEFDINYYLQEPGGEPIDCVLSGLANQAVKIFGDAAHGDVDYRYFFQIFLREQGKYYASADLVTSQNLSKLTYKSYVLALSNKVDPKISTSDAVIATTAPYTGMSITFYPTPFVRSINGSNKSFGVLINGNGGTLEQIYEFVQYTLRSDNNINAGVGSVRGDTAEELLTFFADTLKTNYTFGFGGVYVENFQSMDINRIVFTDNVREEVKYPYMAAGNILFNDNIKADVAAKYWMFFANDSAATVPTGKNFGTAAAVIVKDNDSVDVKGSVAGRALVNFSYDYSGNVQRGAGSQGKPAPIVIVVQGLETAQYTKATGVITQSTNNVFSLVSTLERSFLE